MRSALRGLCLRGFSFEVYAYEVRPARFVPRDAYALWRLRLRSLCLRGLHLAPRFSFEVCTLWRLRLVMLTPYEVCPARSTLYGAYVLRGLHLQLVVPDSH